LEIGTLNSAPDISIESSRGTYKRTLNRGSATLKREFISKRAEQKFKSILKVWVKIGLCGADNGGELRKDVDRRGLRAIIHIFKSSAMVIFDISAFENSAMIMISVLNDGGI
jgi:hypothetical protein